MTIPFKSQNRYHKAPLLVIFALLFWATQNLYAQTIPTAPNQRNKEGKRIGEWVRTYTKNWKETSIADSIAFSER